MKLWKHCCQQALLNTCWLYCMRTLWCSALEGATSSTLCSVMLNSACVKAGGAGMTEIRACLIPTSARPSSQADHTQITHTSRIRLVYLGRDIARDLTMHHWHWRSCSIAWLCCCIAAADHALPAADLINTCRCFPNFDSALLADVVTAVGLKAHNGSSTLYSSTFGSASQRLQRYIADIHKGILIILVSGMCPAPSHMAPWLCV